MFSVLVIITGGVILSVGQATGSYDVSGTEEVSNMSEASQTLQDRITLPYE